MGQRTCFCSIHRTYENDDQKVKNAVYGARHNQNVISTNTMSWLCEIPETVYWRATSYKHAARDMKSCILPLEDRREDRRSVIGCHDTDGDIKKKPKLLDGEYAAVECETVGKINQHRKFFSARTQRMKTHMAILTAEVEE